MNIIKFKTHYINVANLLLSYPKTFMDRVKRVLLNLSYSFPDYGEPILFGEDLDTHRILMNELNIDAEEINFVRILADIRVARSTTSGYAHLRRLTARLSMLNGLNIKRL